MTQTTLSNIIAAMTMNTNEVKESGTLSEYRKGEANSIDPKWEEKLKEAGLIYDTMENYYNQIYYRPEDDMCQTVVDITDDFIICAWYSGVLEPEIRLYDHQYNLVAVQRMYKDACFGWLSFVFGPEDER